MCNEDEVKMELDLPPNLFIYIYVLCALMHTVFFTDEFCLCLTVLMHITFMGRWTQSLHMKHSHTFSISSVTVLPGGTPAPARSLSNTPSTVGRSSGRKRASRFCTATLSVLPMMPCRRTHDGRTHKTNSGQQSTGTCWVRTTCYPSHSLCCSALSWRGVMSPLSNRCKHLNVTLRVQRLVEKYV